MVSATHQNIDIMNQQLEHSGWWNFISIVMIILLLSSHVRWTLSFGVWLRPYIPIEGELGKNKLYEEVEFFHLTDSQEFQFM